VGEFVEMRNGCEASVVVCCLVIVSITAAVFIRHACPDTDCGREDMKEIAVVDSC
jgi:hypothetical protein